MSKAFPSEKDQVIDDIEEAHGLNLSEEEYDSLRKLSVSDLMLVAVLLGRVRARKVDET